MRALAAAACLPLLLVGAAQAQTLSGSQIPANAPTLHQFGNALDSGAYFAGQVECGAGALTASVPVGCLNTDLMSIQSADVSLSTYFQLGGTWAAGDKVGIDFWLGTGTGSYNDYPVVYTVQSSDISGGGNSLATYQNIVYGLVGNDQSGQTTGGCINGTGGYGPALGNVPGAPANCTGTSAFLAADENFPDTAPVAGNGYRPQATSNCGSSGACFLVMDFPWGNEVTGGFANYPAVNVALPTVTSAHGTLTILQQPGATIQNQVASSGNTLDNGPVLWLLRGNVNGNARPDVVGDVLGRIGFWGSFDEYGSIFAVPRGLSANASAATGSTITLTAAPVGVPDLSLATGVGDGTMSVQDATQACALGVGTVLSGWNSGTLTLTLSQPINVTAPCPGVAAGDVISFTDSSHPHGGMGFAPDVTIGPTLFIDEGVRTTSTGGGNSACASDPGYGNMVVCGFLHVGSLEIGGVQVSPTFSGTSGSIGGSSVGAGACTSGAVSVSGASTAMAVAASPATYPGDGFDWRGYVSASGTVTVKVCNETSGSLTPTASAYNVRVLQ
jgi:hypothetical protein